MKKIDIKTSVLDYVFILLGSVLYAVAISVFIEPNDVVSGGVVGIALVINKVASFIPVGMGTLIINIPLFIIGFLKFKTDFIVKTTVTTVISSFLMDAAAKWLPKYTGNIMLAAIAGGVLSGAGIAVVMMRGATTGGTDIVAKLINKKYRYITIGRVSMFVNTLIILVAGLIYNSFEAVLYSVLNLFVESVVIDKLLYGADNGKMLHIITSYPENIIKGINDIDRGVTKIDAHGGYTEADKTLLLCVVRPSEVSKVLSIIKEYDETAFVTVSEVGEILGDGFRKLDM